MSFSLTPGRNEDVPDLTNKIGISAFRTGIASLQISFDGNSKDISLFQSQLNRRANTSGWNFKAGDILKYLSTWASRMTFILSMTASRVITSVARDFNFRTRKKFIKKTKIKISTAAENTFPQNVKAKQPGLGINH